MAQLAPFHSPLVSFLRVAEEESAVGGGGLYLRLRGRCLHWPWTLQFTEIEALGPEWVGPSTL